jgi:hypothetical protein
VAIAKGTYSEVPVYGRKGRSPNQPINNAKERIDRAKHPYLTFMAAFLAAALRAAEQSGMDSPA